MVMGVTKVTMVEKRVMGVAKPVRVVMKAVAEMEEVRLRCGRC